MLPAVAHDAEVLRRADRHQVVHKGAELHLLTSQVHNYVSLKWSRQVRGGELDLLRTQ